MADGLTHEWFLEVDGKRTGPFPTDQILGLLADGEIPPTQRILSTQVGSDWITVRELAERHRSPSAPVSPSQPPKPFVPPPRPAELQPASSHQPPAVETVAIAAPAAPPAAKPELSLIDALLAAKERKASTSRAIPPHGEETTSGPWDLRQIPRKAWMIGATALLLCGATWGMVHFVKHKASPSAEIADSAKAFPPQPFAGSAPAAATLPVATVPQPARTSLPIAPASIHAPAPAPAPAPLNPQANLAAEREREEREREQEIEREREREREREIASEGFAQPQMPPPGIAHEAGVPAPGGPGVPPMPEGAPPGEEHMAVPVVDGIPVE